jgi:hypothetical protein
MDETTAKRLNELERKMRRLTRRVTDLERSAKVEPKLIGPKLVRM